jgi:hypothetical protein
LLLCHKQSIVIFNYNVSWSGTLYRYMH